MRNLSESPARANRHAISVKPQPLPPRAAIIAECTITTDSVVATATVRTERTMRRIVVQWGDGAVNTLRNKPGVEAAVGHQNQLLPGTYRLSHAYEAPEDRKPFEQLVLIRVEDQSGGVDFCLNQITLTPRYKVTQYRIGLNLESRCDSWVESWNEFDIVLFVDEEPVKYWRWEPSQSLIGGEPVFVLEGSLISRELTVADGTVSVHLDITEVDPISDDELDLWKSFSALSNSETMSGVMGDDCQVGYSYDLEVKLIVPLPSYGQDVVMVADA